MIFPAPPPTPPALKTIVKETVTPLCTEVRGRLGAAIVAQGRNNQVLVKTFPILNDYNRALTVQDDAHAYFAAHKLAVVDDRLSASLASIRSVLLAGAQPSPSPSTTPSPEDATLSALRTQLQAIYDRQKTAQAAIHDFVGETLYSAAPEGRRLMMDAQADNSAAAASAARFGLSDEASQLNAYVSGHAAPVAFVAMPQLPVIVLDNLRKINDLEAALRPAVAASVSRCFSKTGAPHP